MHQSGIALSRHRPTSRIRSAATIRTKARSSRAGSRAIPQQLRGDKRRVRAESFKEHFAQATLFWNSQSDIEKEHIISAFSFELTKVQRPEIRERALSVLANVDATLVARIAENLGLDAPAAPARGRNGEKNGKSATPAASPALSLMNQPSTPKGRSIAILAAPGVDAAAVAAAKKAFAEAGAHATVVAPRLGALSNTAKPIDADATILTMPSVVFDAVYVPGGAKSVATLSVSGVALHFLAEAYKHAKPIAASDDAEQLLLSAGVTDGPGVIFAEPNAAANELIAALATHRVWERAEIVEAIPA